MLLKRNIILCIWCKCNVYCGLGFKKHIFHILYIIVAHLCSAFLKRPFFFLQSSNRSEKRGVLWLASHPVPCDWPNTSSVWWKCYGPLLYCDAVSRLDETNIKTHYKLGIGYIQWGHNDRLWLILSFYASRCIVLCKHYHVCICDQRHDQQQA